MKNDRIDSIRQNVIGSVMLFQCAESGYVPFYLVDDIDRVNGMISISVALSVGQKITIDDTLDLRLIKCKMVNNGFDYCILEQISLNGNHLKDVRSTFKVMNNNESFGEEYRIRNNYTFTIRDIPVPEAGRYAVSLVIPDIDGFYSLASFYFNIVDRQKYIGLGNLVNK